MAAGTTLGVEDLCVDRGSAGMRLDLFLAQHFSAAAKRPVGLTRAGIQRLIAEGQITRNGLRTKASARLKLNDRIKIQSSPARDSPLRSEALPLDIIYEDANCIVINKAAGMVVHPAAGRQSGTVVNALLYHCPDLIGIGGVSRPGIVHRLDKDTSGVMIIAKNSVAFHQLVVQFKNRTVRKEYLALVWGALRPEEGIIGRSIGRHRSDRKRMSSLHAAGRVREAVTEWQVQERFNVGPRGGSSYGVTLLRLRPRTGRTHQLRVHLADLGFPLVGDQIYGSPVKTRSKMSAVDPILGRFPRQALHAARLVVELGENQEAKEFVAPLPADFADLLDHLRWPLGVDNQRSLK